jgi:GNAT superfamily N-acetyltransferase
MDICLNATISPAQLLPLFQQTDFADQRDAAGVQRMLESPASVHVSAWEGERLVGFARGLSDGVYIGLVVDVVVDAPFRGQGIGRALIGALGHALKDVEGIHLGCEEELVPFYQKLGWQQDDCAVMVPTDA